MDDLIRRSDAIKAVSKVDDYGDGIGFEIRSHCLVELELVPSADRPQGEWIMSKPEEKGFGVVFQCSRCSCEVDCVPTNFCPDCGCRMKGADDESV